MPDFAYLLDPVRPEFVTNPTDDEREVSQRHYEYLRWLDSRGVLTFAARVRERGGIGVVAVDAADEADARRIMESDPQVAKGHMRGRVAPLSVARF